MSRYDVPVHRDLGLLVIYCYFQLRLYGDRDVPAEARDPGWSSRDPGQAGQIFVQTQYLGTPGWSEMKFKTLSDQAETSKKESKKK